jgi:hypothetical protein
MKKIQPTGIVPAGIVLLTLIAYDLRAVGAISQPSQPKPVVQVPVRSRVLCRHAALTAAGGLAIASCSRGHERIPGMVL